MKRFMSKLQYIFLKTFYRIDTSIPASYNRLGLHEIFTADFPEKVKDRFVVDFGCGLGGDTETMAKWGAKLSLGLELRQELVVGNSQRVTLTNCSFATSLSDELKGKADLIISIDAFEHFSDPAAILGIMHGCLKKGGEAYISFGPTWYHPYGGHSFSVFPWAHLLLNEGALIKWRNEFYHDGATKFSEVAGGLNQLPIAEFLRLFKESGFVIEELVCKPIRKQRWLQRILGRELMTSMVMARLKKT